jgi:hypothetical protein
MVKKTLDEKLLDQITKLNLSPEDAKKLIRNFKQKDHTKIYKYKHGRSNKFKIAIVGDVHIGNKSCNKEALKDFYKRAHEQHGVTKFYQVGDLTDGLHVHRGMVYEQYAVGLDAQVEDLVKHYPELKGCTTYFITGNHDLWSHSNVGVDLGSIVEAKRDDMIYLGPEQADIKVAKNTTLRLLHPGGGSSYALSYKPQKIIEAMSGGEKPNILAIGHYHKMLQMFYRNVHVFMAGTFCEQTPFMRRNGLAAHVGSWIVEGKSNDKGISEIMGKFIPYYEG